MKYFTSFILIIASMYTYSQRAVTLSKVKNTVLLLSIDYAADTTLAYFNDVCIGTFTPKNGDKLPVSFNSLMENYLNSYINGGCYAQRYIYIDIPPKLWRNTCNQFHIVVKRDKRISSKQDVDFRASYPIRVLPKKHHILSIFEDVGRYSVCIKKIQKKEDVLDAIDCPRMEGKRIMEQQRKKFRFSPYT